LGNGLEKKKWRENMIDQFRAWYENRHDYARQWKKKTGGKIVGYFCTYVPEEILYAADILPVRILGSHEPQSVTEPHLFAMFCPFCRDCLAQGLEGKYDYLDGLMIAQSCLHIRQTFHSWKDHIPTEFNYLLPMPNALQSKSSLAFLKEEILQFKKELEEWAGHEITRDDLMRGIETMNRNRRLMKQVYELRKSDTPPITGLESMVMVVSGQVVDKNEHSQVIEEILTGELKGRLTDRDPGVRLMVIGSEDDDTKFIEMVEEEGSTIVCDDHCTGTRYFWDEVEVGTDPIFSVTKRYIHRTPCPSKDWPERLRFKKILEFANDFNVEGAILIQQKFCDPHECDMVALRQLLGENGIKTLFLEFDVTVPLGPFRIRVDAFLETLGAEDLF
jgi:benzoyl-CoA reductase subunit C